MTMPPQDDREEQEIPAPPAYPQQPPQPQYPEAHTPQEHQQQDTQPQPQQPQPQQQWAWAQPQPVLVQTPTEPLAYHRLYRGVTTYKWWKPLLVLILSASIFFALNIAFTVLIAPLLFIFDPDYVDDALITGVAPILDTQHPLSLVMSLGVIILMIPSVLIAMLALGIRPTGRVWSVAGRIRWGLLGRTTGAAVVGVLVMNAVAIAFDMVVTGLTGAEPEEVFLDAGSDFNVTAAIISMVIVLLMVPFQATAEEVVFRGLFLQVLGSWMKSPWLAIGLSSLAFAVMHIYDIWGLLAVGLMGLVAAWLTWKTGGLEAAIAIHIMNNLIAFAFMASGVTGETGQVESGGGLPSIVGEVAGLAIFSWLVLRIFAKHGYGRERIDYVLRPAPETSVPETQSPGTQAPGAQAGNPQA